MASFSFAFILSGYVGRLMGRGGLWEGLRGYQEVRGDNEDGLKGMAMLGMKRGRGDDIRGMIELECQKRKGL